MAWASRVCGMANLPKFKNKQLSNKMKTNKVSIGLAALVGLALTSISAVAGGNGPSFHGGGFYAGGSVHFGVHAVTHRDGTVTGQIEAHNSLNGLVLHGEITCLEVNGNTAILIGRVTDGFYPPVGDITGWSIAAGVRDNGEGANAAPDLLSRFFLIPPGDPRINPSTCFILPAFEAAILSDLDLANRPLEGGNFQIRE